MSIGCSAASASAIAGRSTRCTKTAASTACPRPGCGASTAPPSSSSTSTAGRSRLPEHAAGGPLVYLETDPVELADRAPRRPARGVDVHRAALRLLHLGPELRQAATVACRCRPASASCPARRRSLLDEWSDHRRPAGRALHHVGNWEQRWRDVTFDGVTYHWSKHFEFMKVLDLPSRTSAPLELALVELPATRTASMLEQHGWRVRPALDFSADLDAYRDVHPALARGVQRRQGPERAAPQRLVQRAQRDLPRGRDGR